MEKEMAVLMGGGEGIVGGRRGGGGNDEAPQHISRLRSKRPTKF